MRTHLHTARIVVRMTFGEVFCNRLFPDVGCMPESCDSAISLLTILVM